MMQGRCGKKGSQKRVQKVLDLCGCLRDNGTRRKGTLVPPTGAMHMRIAIYARVSTDDKGQDPENQLRQLRAWCANAGHEIVHQYVDKETGRKGTKERKQFAALFDDPTSVGSTACCSGRSIVSAARAW